MGACAKQALTNYFQNRGLISDTSAHQIRRVGVCGSQQEVGGQRVAARGAASSADNADPALGQAFFSQLPVPRRLAPVDEHHHMLVQAQAQVRKHLKHTWMVNILYLCSAGTA